MRQRQRGHGGGVAWRGGAVRRQGVQMVTRGMPMEPTPAPLDIPPRVPLSLIWLRATFNSRSRTEELFRPDLENGILTQHDFDAAVDFLPGPQRYYTVRRHFYADLTLFDFSLRSPVASSAHCT
jgi:hypothetical protein